MTEVYEAPQLVRMVHQLQKEVARLKNEGFPGVNRLDDGTIHIDQLSLGTGGTGGFRAQPINMQKPGVPTSLATTAGSDEVNVYEDASWSWPDDSPAEVIGFEVRYRRSGDPEYILLYTQQNGIRLNHLDSETTYEWGVRSVSKVGYTSDWVAGSNFLTLASSYDYRKASGSYMRSTNFDGLPYAISTDPGTTGWAFNGLGEAAFNGGIWTAGTIKSGTGANYVEIPASANEINLYYGSSIAGKLDYDSGFTVIGGVSGAATRNTGSPWLWFDTSGNAALVPKAGGNTFVGSADGTSTNHGHLWLGGTAGYGVTIRAGSNTLGNAPGSDIHIDAGDPGTIRIHAGGVEIHSSGTTEGGELRLMAGSSGTATAFIDHFYGAGDWLRFHSSPAGVLMMLDLATPVYSNSVSGRDVYITSSGELGYLSSAKRNKTNIKPLDRAEVVRRLRLTTPVRFRYKREIDDSGALQIGVIADDEVDIWPELIYRDDDGNVEGFAYRALGPALVTGWQDHDDRLMAIEAALERMQGDDR